VRVSSELYFNAEGFIFMSLRRIAKNTLFISEPTSSNFGNKANDSNNPLWTNSNWLKSRFHFSFAEWSGGPSNFGSLRVLNDDLVQGQRGFGRHGHSNMEIVTIVVGPGKLTHADSFTKVSESLGRGGVQFMSAGSGVQHSEQNAGDLPVRFIQVTFFCC
jgi:redox-sensitive bicupin YhaK (pirin superfamily)